MSFLRWKKVGLTPHQGYIANDRGIIFGVVNGRDEPAICAYPGVECDSCENRLPCPKCILDFKRLYDLNHNSTFLHLLSAVNREDDVAPHACADWLAENGYDDLSDLMFAGANDDRA